LKLRWRVQTRQRKRKSPSLPRPTTSAKAARNPLRRPGARPTRYAGASNDEQSRHLQRARCRRGRSPTPAGRGQASRGRAEVGRVDRGGRTRGTRGVRLARVAPTQTTHDQHARTAQQGNQTPHASRHPVPPTKRPSCDSPAPCSSKPAKIGRPQKPISKPRPRNTNPKKPFSAQPLLDRCWHLSPDTILNWIRSGQLRPFNVHSPGKRASWRIPRAALDEFTKLRSNAPVLEKPGRRRVSAGERFFD